MDEILKFLDKVIAIQNDVLAVKPRVVNTIGSGVKVLNAALTVDLGETERAVISRLADIATKAQALVG